MRPRKLVIEGLRSYRGRTEIDFSQVGLFAITGPTGAGKSSILEALYFALYHAATFDSRGVKALISDSATDMTVHLEFRVGDQEWSITRSVSLSSRPPVHELRGPDDQVFDSAKDVNNKVEELLGLSGEDFLKTVVLPQGRFQALLHSTPKQRSPLLRSLLGLDAFDGISERVKTLQNRLNQALFQVRGRRQALGEDPAAQVLQLQQQEQQARAAEEKLHEQLKSLRLSASELERVKEQQEQRRQQLEQLHLEELPDSKQFDTLLEMARDFEQDRGRLQAAWEDLKASLKTLAEELSNRQSQGKGSRELGRLAQMLTAIEALSPRLQDLEQQLRQLDQRRRQEEQQAEELQRLQSEGEQRLNELTAEGQQAAEQLKLLRETLEGCRELDRALQQNERQLEELGLEEQTAEQTRRTLEVELKEAKVGLGKAQEQAQAARRHFEHLRRQNELGALCQGLQPDQPCPVCDRALPPDWQAPAGGDLEAAETGAEQAAELEKQAEKAMQKIELQLGAVTEQQKNRVQRSQKLHEQSQELCQKRQQLSALELPALLAQQEEAEKKHLELRERYAEHRKEQKAFEQRLQEVEKRRQQHHQELEERQKQTATLAQQLEQHRAELSAALGEEDWAQTLENEREATEKLETTLQQKHQQENELLRQREQLEQQCRQQLEQPVRQLENALRRLHTLLGFKEAFPDEPELEQLRRLHLQLKERRKQKLESLSQAQAGSARALEESQRELQEALEEYGLEGLEQAEAAAQKLTEERVRCSQLKEQAELHSKLAAELDQALRPAEKLQRALEFLNGTLGHRRSKGNVSFADWMLERRQRELLEIASRAFGEMSDGQYGFSGDFGVVDRASGQQRKSNTLSGGESFLASLALALGLSELVGRRGGRLEAFFLDEGFGTLSPECLDRALDALEKLAQTGRVIGVISHVGGVAERLETVWQVVKTPAGSEIRTVAAREEPLPEALLEPLAAPPTSPGPAEAAPKKKKKKSPAANTNQLELFA